MPADQVVIRCRAAGALLLAAVALTTGEAFAVPVVRCETLASGERRDIEFVASPDPYTVRPVDFNGHFRFKAVLSLEGGKPAYVKLYTYHVVRGRAVLSHLSRHLNPPIGDADAPGSLGGRQWVYSPVLGRAFEFACVLVEGAS